MGLWYLCLFHGESEIHLSATNRFLHRHGDTSYLGKRYSPAFSYHQSYILRMVMNCHGSTLSNQTSGILPLLFEPHPGMPENVTVLRDAGWFCGLTKVTIYPACTNQHQKIAVLTAPIPGPSRSRVVSYPVTHKQLKQNNSGHLR